NDNRGNAGDGTDDDGERDDRAPLPQPRPPALLGRLLPCTISGRVLPDGNGVAACRTASPPATLDPVPLASWLPTTLGFAPLAVWLPIALPCAPDTVTGPSDPAGRPARPSGPAADRPDPTGARRRGSGWADGTRSRSGSSGSPARTTSPWRADPRNRSGRCHQVRLSCTRRTQQNLPVVIKPSKSP